jgi:hypothetical protein
MVRNRRRWKNGDVKTLIFEWCAKSSPPNGFWIVGWKVRGAGLLYSLPDAMVPWYLPSECSISQAVLPALSRHVTLSLPAAGMKQYDSLKHDP